MGNIQLLKKTRDHILMYPDEHNQNLWFCETSMCIAGHAAVLAGAKVVNDIDFGIGLQANGDWISAPEYAGSNLGLTREEREYLFYCMDNETAIKRMDQVIQYWEEGKQITDLSFDEYISYPAEFSEDDEGY